MSNRYLVVIDTTGRSNAKAFSKGIQNFYFVYAADGETARQMVLASFRSRPELLAQLVPCVKATPIDQILRLLNDRENSWSYVPMAGVRAPGQQATVVAANPESQDYQSLMGKESPPPPRTYSTQNDTITDHRKIGPLTEKDAKLLTSPPPQQVPNAGGIDMNNPDQVKALLAQLLTAMNNPVSPATPAPAKQFVPPPTLKADELDDETRRRIAANATAGPKIEYVDEGMPPTAQRPRGGGKANEWGEIVE